MGLQVLAQLLWRSLVAGQSRNDFVAVVTGGQVGVFFVLDEPIPDPALLFGAEPLARSIDSGSVVLLLGRVVDVGVVGHVGARDLA